MAFPEDQSDLTMISGWFGEAFPLLWFAKFLGALTGSIVSLAYVMPRGRREAASRLLVGLVTGLIFGGTAGVKLADTMGLLGKVSPFEITLMGATLASLCAWWGLGALHRLMERNPLSLFRPSDQQALNRKGGDAAGHQNNHQKDAAP